MGTLRTEQCLPSLADPKSIFWRIPFFSNATEVPRPKAQPPSWQREKLTECLNLYTSPSPAVYDMGTLRTEQCLPSLADPKSIFWRIPFFSNATEVPRPKAQPPSWQREKLTECLNLYTSPSPAVYDMGTLRTEQCLPSLADPKSIFWRIPFFSNATEVPRPKAQPPSWQREKLTECLNLYTSPSPAVYDMGTLRTEQCLPSLADPKSIFWRIPFFSNATEVPRPKAQPPSWQREKLTECLNLYTSPSPAVYDMGTLRTEQCLPSLADPKSIFWRIPFFSNATEVPRPKAQPPSWQREKLTECLNLYTSPSPAVYDMGTLRTEQCLPSLADPKSIFWRIPFFSNATEVPRPKAQPPSWQREKLTGVRSILAQALLYMIWVPYVLSNAFQVWRIQNQFSGGYPFLAMPRRCPGQRHSLLAGKGKN
jgi:hypothetical protein